MATEESGNLEIMEETPPTTPTEQEPKKKRPGARNPDQAAEFVLQTTQTVDRFMSKMQHESDTVEENYQVLIAEYHHSLCIIEDYFKQADRKLVLELIDDTTCPVNYLEQQHLKMLQTKRSVLTPESQQKIL